MSLYSWGHNSSVWGDEVRPPKEGHVVEIVAPYYVSRPCWEKIVEAADHIDTVELDFRKFIDWAEDTEKEHVHQFFFSDLNVAKEMALIVQKSARNIRKNIMRRIRLDEAGGFHNKEVLDRLYEIQQGRCYYSGDSLTKKPKNFVVDHICSIYLGGTNWPCNLALVIQEINTWKGGHASSEDTLQWLAEKRGKDWLRLQKAYCLEVDKEREKLDLEFRNCQEK